MKVDLLLLRHGEAVPYINENEDHQRSLTEKGSVMAKSHAVFLQTSEWPIPRLVLTSGYLRAEQTRKEIQPWANSKIFCQSVFSPMGTAQAMLRVLLENLRNEFSKVEDPSSVCIAIVGHNPSLGELRRALLSNDEELSSVGFKLCELNWLQGNLNSAGDEFEPFSIKSAHFV
jgi:phosphohistidine phosphatase SixA